MPCMNAAGTQDHTQRADKQAMTHTALCAILLHTSPLTHCCKTPFLLQGFQLHCPACGHVSTTLKTQHQLQQALSCSHTNTSSGAACDHLTKLHEEDDLLHTHPATQSLSTAPQHAAADAGTSSKRRKKPRHADSSLQGDLMPRSLAKRVMGVILANLAMHILTATAGARGAKLPPAGQKLLPCRSWAVDLLTQVG